jgi:Predicted membrane protein
MVGMLVVWILQVVIGYLVYQDARARGMNAALWFILVIIPLLGFLFAVIYFIIREDSPVPSQTQGKSALQILGERYARGEISTEEYTRMKEELQK